MNTLARALVPMGSILLAACAHEREFRVAYVGSEGSAQIAGDDDAGPSPAARPVVAAGNTLLGPAGTTWARGGATRRVVNGSVTSVLPATNQTLVKLATGATVLLNGAGGTLGDLVSIDLGANRVVGGSRPLIGSTVLGGSGPLAKITAAPVQTVGKLVNLSPSTGTSAVTNVIAPVRATTSTVTSILTKPLTKGCC